MNRLHRFFLCLLILPSAIASEIIGWKSPLSNITWEGLDDPGIVRLEKAPEKSPFFGLQDELWDVRGVLPEDVPPTVWAVWNATTGRVVVKGSWPMIRAIEPRIITETACRITVEAFLVGDDGLPPDFTKQPDASMSLIVRSGQKCSSSMMAKDAAIQVLAEPYTAPDYGIIDLSLEISTALPGAPDLKINTAVGTRDRKSLWMARDFDGNSGTDIRVTAAIVLPDGTPYEEMLMRQVGDTAVPFHIDRIPDHLIAVEGGGWLAAARLDAVTARLQFTGKTDEEIDPFAAGTGNWPVDPFNGLPTATVPAKLEPYFGGEVVDFRKVIRDFGINIGDGDFVGYDTRFERVFMYSMDKREIDKFEVLYGLMGAFRGPQNMSISIKGDGEMWLLARSGRKATLENNRKDTHEKRSLEIEPTIGEQDVLVDLRIFYEEKSGDEIVKHLNTSVTLQKGESLEILKSKLPDGSESKMKVKAEILERQ